MNRTVVRTFGGSGRAPGLFGDPAGVAIDKSGNLIIADAKNNRLQVTANRNTFNYCNQSLGPFLRNLDKFGFQTQTQCIEIALL